MIKRRNFIYFFCALVVFVFLVCCPVTASKSTYNNNSGSHNIAIEIGNSLKIKKKSTLAKREFILGHFQNIPFMIKNSGNRAISLMVHIPDNINDINLVPLIKTIVPGENELITLRLQVLNPQAEEIPLLFSFNRTMQRINMPISVSIKEKTPLFGGLEHFDRYLERFVPGNLKARLMRRLRNPFISKRNMQADMEFTRNFPLQCYRADLSWKRIEMKKGAYSWNVSDWYVDNIIEHMNALPIGQIGYQPRWAGNFTDPRDTKLLEQYAEFVENIVQRYKERIKYWEIWNEPIAFLFRPPRHEGAEYYLNKHYFMLSNIIKLSSKIIRKNDPRAKILTPGFHDYARHPFLRRNGKSSPPYLMLEKLLKNNMGAYVDAIGVHNFPTCYGCEPPPLTSAEQWRLFDVWADMSDVLRLLKKYNVDKPIWLTEVGGFINSQKTDRATGIAILRTLSIVSHQKAEGIVLAKIFDYPSLDPGARSDVNIIKHKNHTKTIPFKAFRSVIQYLTGVTPVEYKKFKIIREKPYTPKDVEIRLFHRSDEDIIALWNNTLNDKKIIFDLKEGNRNLRNFEYTGHLFNSKNNFVEPFHKSHTRSFTLTPLGFAFISVRNNQLAFSWMDDIKW